MKEKCWCGKPKFHAEKEMATDFARMFLAMRKSVVEFDKPKEDGQIGTVSGIPVYILKEK